MQRYTFPPAGGPKLVFDPARSVEGVADGGFRVIGDREVAGWRRGRYPVFFVARFSRPFDSSGAIDKGGWVGWDEGGEVTVSFGISFVDEDGARRNLEAEAPDFDFDAMRAATRAAWNRELSKVRVSGGSELDLKSFYTALYRSQLHPNTFTDVDGRYRGMDDQDPRGQGPHPVLELLVVGPLQVVAPADRDDPARALPRDAAQPAGRPPRGRLHPALEGAVDRRGPHVGRPGDPDDRRRRLPRPRRRRRRRRRSTTPRSTWSRGATPSCSSSAGCRTGRARRSSTASPTSRWRWWRTGSAMTTEAAEHLERSLNYRNILDPETHWIRRRNADGNWADAVRPGRRRVARAARRDAASRRATRGSTRGSRCTTRAG